MNKEIVVGEGETVCTSWTLFDNIPGEVSSISQNSSYFEAWRLKILGIDVCVRVFRNTPEGKIISDTVEQIADVFGQSFPETKDIEAAKKFALENLEKVFLKIFMQHATPEQILSVLKETAEKAKKEGIEEHKSQIRSILGC